MEDSELSFDLKFLYSKTPRATPAPERRRKRLPGDLTKGSWPQSALPCCLAFRVLCQTLALSDFGIFVSENEAFVLPSRSCSKRLLG